VLYTAPSFTEIYYDTEYWVSQPEYKLAIKVYIGRCNFKKLNDMEVQRKYLVKI
jgi:hypothetical protein